MLNFKQLITFKNTIHTKAENCLIGKVYVYGEKKKNYLMCAFMAVYRKSSAISNKIVKETTNVGNENKSKYLELILYNRHCAK